jgi:hypothetical protein
MRGLNFDIGRAMASLYDLQTAIINANGEIIPHESHIFQQIRAALKVKWEDVVTLLKQCHSFGCDVERLRAAHSSATHWEIINFLKNMSKTCRECVMSVKYLTANHEKVIFPYKKNEEAFKNELEYPKVLVEPGDREPGNGREVRPRSYSQGRGGCTFPPFESG